MGPNGRDQRDRSTSFNRGFSHRIVKQNNAAQMNWKTDVLTYVNLELAAAGLKFDQLEDFIDFAETLLGAGDSDLKTLKRLKLRLECSEGRLPA
jgi:hypothetical protein